jgi:hypothetical protein
MRRSEKWSAQVQVIRKEVGCVFENGLLPKGYHKRNETDEAKARD